MVILQRHAVSPVVIAERRANELSHGGISLHVINVQTTVEMRDKLTS